MINLSASGGSVVFTFANSTYYLYGDGTITVPVNSLSLVIDNSDIATFKKAATNDIFVAAPVAEFGMSKSELEAFYKNNMVGSTGGGGGGIDSGTVQSMIDASISGKADTSAVTAVDNALTAHTANTAIHVTVGDKLTWNAKSDFSGSYNDLTDKPTIPVVPTSNTAFTNDAGYITEDAISGKADTSAVTAVNNVLTAHTANTTIHVTAGDKLTWDAKSDFSGSYNDLTDKPTIPTVPTSNTAFTNDAGYATSGYVDSAVSGKQDALVSGTNIKTINNESLLGSGNIDIQGGGKAIEAGRGITVTTGETADTVSLNVVNEYYGTVNLATNDRNVYNGSIMIGRSYIDNKDHAIAIGTTTSSISGGAYIYGSGGIGIGTNVVERSRNGIAIGYFSSAGTSDLKFSSCAIGTNAESYGDYSTALSRTKVNNESEFGSGKYNVSSSASTTFGDSGNTLFSVGNGTADNARHNAFEIRQNGDIYISKDGQDVKLQDQLGGGAASSAITSGDTNAVAGGAVYDKFDEVEQVTAAALNALNDNFGGLKLVRLTQQEYDNLSVKNSQTLYIIVDVPSYKWLATYTGGATDSASCDSTSAITNTEITKTDLESIIIGDCVTSIGDYAFQNCSDLTSVTISNSVTTIGQFAFLECPNLVEVTIGSGVTSIGQGAFATTNGSFTLTIHATTPPTLTNGIFTAPNGGIFVPAEAVQDYQNANIWSNYAQGIQPIQ